MASNNAPPSQLRPTPFFLKSESGAFDLPSIIVGVVVVGILTAGVFAAIFGVIPFSQDKAAKQDLAAVRTAEGVAKATGTDGRFLNASGLVSGGYIEATPTLAVSTDAEGSCYISVSKSGSGSMFYSTSGSNEPKKYVSGASAADCAAEKSLDELVADVSSGPSASPGADNDGDGIPNDSDPTPDGGTTGTPTALDSDGDSAPNAFDASPNGETGYALAGWGGNWSGELGTTVADSELASPTGSVMQGDLAGVRMSLMSENTGSYHACGVTETTSELYCWGQGNRGELGNGASTDSSVPVKVDDSGVLAGKTVTQIVAHAYNTCVIADGAPYCWGHYPLFGYTDNPTPAAIDTSGVLAGKTITKLVGGNQFACVLADGAPYCWGMGGQGQLGNGTMGQNPDGTWYGSPEPVAVDVSGVLAGKTINDLFTANSSTCATTNDGAYCWGKNNHGQLGNGTYTNSAVPVAVGGPLAGKAVTEMAGTYNSVCAVAEGSTYCWGDGRGGILGDGVEYVYDFSGNKDTYHQTLPVAVDTSTSLGSKTVTGLSMGDMHVCALANQEVHCWGEGDQQFASASYGVRLSPVRIDSGVIAGKPVLGLWTTGGSTLVSYLK